MAITLSADQRNAIRDQIFVRLSGIDDVRLKAQAGDFQTARRLAEEYADDLRLLNECLGWEEEADGEEFELALPLDVLRRVFSRHCHIALANDASEQPERVELRENEEVNSFVVRTCRRVLAEVDSLA